MMRSPIARLAALGAASLLLQACALSPGMHLDRSSLSATDSAESSMVELLPITPKLLAQEQAVRNGLHIADELLEYTPGNYRIGPNDGLFITVWDHPELTIPGGQQQASDANVRTVRADGTLFYPFIGSVQVAGMTQEQLREVITRRLARFIEQPQVDVNIIRYNSQKVTLSGAFREPGFQPITSEPLSLLQAVGRAGIENNRADLSHLRLIRDGQTHMLDFDRLTSNPSSIGDIFLKDGDQLHLAFNDTRRIFVMGEVRNPRALPYSTSRMTLSEVLGTVGGPTPETSSGKSVYVIRGVENIENERATVYQLDASSPVAMVLAGQFHMQPQDVVFIGAAGITRWNRVVSQLFPSANLFRTGLLIEEDVRDRGNN